jgi:glycosyltransferase involved in cell wall biosynthesis
MTSANDRLTSVSITVPVYDEEIRLANSIPRILLAVQPVPATRLELVIANNGSADRTLEIAHQLAGKHKNIRVLHLNEKGRGRALKHAWLSSEAEILSYMDVDLSSNLNSFPALIAPLLRGEFDLAVGSRLLRPQTTKRCTKREIISRCYNLMVKAIFHTRFSDAQCGFKAITKAAAQELLPLVEDNDWFFDTELLILAEKLGYRIFDLPVPWIEGSRSSVKIIRAAWQDIRGLIRLRRALGRASSFQNLAKLRSARPCASAKSI